MPETESELVEVAGNATASQFERIAHGYRQAAPHLAEVNARHARRFLDYRYDDDGSLVVRGRLSPEDGAALLAALEAYRNDQPAPSPGDGVRDGAGPEPAEPAEQCSAEPSHAQDRAAAGRAPIELAPLAERNADALVAVARTTLAATNSDVATGEHAALSVAGSTPTTSGTGGTAVRPPSTT
jgi:hypothetical protein